MCGASASRIDGSRRSARGQAASSVRTGFGVAAREQRHIVAEVDERIGQIGHHAFGAAIKFRRDCFVQRRNLCDSHNVTLLFMRASHSGPGRASSECLSDGRARLPPPEIGPDIDRVIPYVHYRYRGRLFRVIFQSLNVVTGRNTGCYKSSERRAIKPIRGRTSRLIQASRFTRAREGSALFAPRSRSRRRSPGARSKARAQ